MKWSNGKFIRYWLPVLIWAGVIFYSSSQPYEEQDLRPTLSNYFNVEILRPYVENISFSYAGSEVSVEALGTAGFLEFLIRKAAHLTVYLVLAFLFYRAFVLTTKLNIGIVFILSWIAAIMYAASDEFHQSLTPNRSPHWEDVTLDSLGALIGVLIAFILYRKILRKKSTS